MNYLLFALMIWIVPQLKISKGLVVVIVPIRPTEGFGDFVAPLRYQFAIIGEYRRSHLAREVD